MEQCDTAKWDSEDLGERVGTVRFEAPSKVGRVLSLLLQRAELLAWVETVTGVRPLDLVTGRVIQIACGTSDRLDWHDDRNDRRRRLAITIDLSAQPFEGGTFELRDVETQKTLLRHRHGQPGNALIFEVARRSEHRVLPLLSGGPRRVYGGWFCTASRCP